MLKNGQGVGVGLEKGRDWVSGRARVRFGLVQYSLAELFANISRV